jgi:thiamine-phosphate pyrophosphorylase
MSDLQLPHPPLMLVTDRRQARRALGDIVAQALEAGCRWISVREKDLPEDEQVLLVRSLLPLAHSHGATLTVHASASLAVTAGADGAHLSSRSDLAAARARLGPGKLLGVSIHAVTEAETIDPERTNYALAGPAFETESKPGYGPQIGRSGVAEIARAARVPVLAIGGVNAARLGELVSAGAAGVAVMGSVMRAADPAREIGGLIVALRGALAMSGRDRY